MYWRHVIQTTSLPIRKSRGLPVKTPACQPQQIGDESIARAGCKYYDSHSQTPTYQSQRDSSYFLSREFLAMLGQIWARRNWIKHLHTVVDLDIIGVWISITLSGNVCPPLISIIKLSSVISIDFLSTPGPPPWPAGLYYKFNSLLVLLAASLAAPISPPVLL